MPVDDVVVIGAGPAGIAAAIQLKRYGVEPVVFEKDGIGGLLREANLVENYPGFPGGVSGAGLAHLFERHLEAAGVVVHAEEVLRADCAGGEFCIETPLRSVSSHILVIASGTTPAGLPSLDVDTGARAEGRIFSSVLPLAQAEGEEIAVIGAGDAAFDYALSLSGKNRVMILSRSTGQRCLPLLRMRAEASGRITYMENTLVKKVMAREDGLEVICSTPSGRYVISPSYLLIATGRKPALGYLSETLKNNMEALRESGRLYLAGDVGNGIYRQAAISAGDGVRTAMEIHRRLQGQGA